MNEGFLDLVPKALFGLALLYGGVFVVVVLLKMAGSPGRRIK